MTLPSCMTAMLWHARDNASSRETVATKNVLAASGPAGLATFTVQLGEDLPNACATQLDQQRSGQWLAFDLQAPAPQLAELLRLQQAGVTRDTGFELWFYGNENVRIEAHAFVEPARTGEVHLEPELMVTPHYGKPSELVAHASGKLRCLAEPPVEGVPVTPATLHWTRRDNEPFSVPTKVALTPVTLVMDVAFGPVALIGICYMQMYHWFGGRG